MPGYCGTSGIGKEIALGLAKMGGAIVLVGRDKEKCDRVAKEISVLAQNPTTTFIVADLSSQSSIRNMACEFKERHGQLDILVNNAERSRLIAKQMKALNTLLQSTILPRFFSPTSLPTYSKRQVSRGLLRQVRLRIEEQE